MKLEIERIRPRLLQDKTHSLLDELRRFRHFFRHAYGMVLMPERVNPIMECAIQLEELFKDDLKNFLDKLKLFVTPP
jgi:hypothetical protein